MPNSYVLTVCLPKTTPADQIADASSALLAAHAITESGPTGYFRTHTRRPTSQLLQPGTGIAAGGPVRLLDLYRMRTDLSHQYANRWFLWH